MSIETPSDLGDAQAFLWPSGVPRPTLEGYPSLGGDWWNQFYSGLVATGDLSPSALRELSDSCRGIVGTIAKVEDWDRPSPWKGLVVGAVQSGKTQSMMGVAALALDAGYRIIVVLAGMKDDLREQTARRFNTQLLLQNDVIPGSGGATTLGGSIGPKGHMRAFGSPFYLDCHQNAVLLPKLCSALQAGRPAVLVVKKLSTSLADLRGTLSAVYERLGVQSVPTLVLDDECDEASVPGGAGDERAVPDAIANLWQGLGISPNVTYLGYTATAAANLLQHPEGALYPHFVWLLRFPGATDSPLQFREPDPDRWYSGGDCFYEEFGDVPGDSSNFLVAPTIEPEHLVLKAAENPSLLDAFRAYFVSGAFRLALEPQRTFDLAAKLPRPHSMMIHTSVAQEDHSKWLKGILELFGQRILENGAVGLDPTVLLSRLTAEEELWREWHRRFEESRERLYGVRPHLVPHARPSWQDVKAQLPQVFENVRIKIVNSNPGNGESLDYDSTLTSGGDTVPPRDIYVIAIGGSRLSRGITIKGLCVSYFARWASSRHEDTIQQMSRWFGYRGMHLEFCRIFTTGEAWEGLEEANYNDMALRLRLAQLMRERRDPAYATMVFRASPHALPTAKLGTGRILNLSFSPYTKVLSAVNYGSLEAANEQLALDIVRLIRKRGVHVVSAGHGTRGLLSHGWSADEVAVVLDRLAFEHHNPSDEENLLGSFFRTADLSRVQGTGIDAECDPYHISAYLKRWSAQVDAPVPAPTFNVGVTFGEMTSDIAPFDIPLLNRQISSDYKVMGGWSGSSLNWPGDCYFDGLIEDLKLGKTERAEGAPGLLLLHVVHKDAVGRTRRGAQRTHHTPFFGISIPGGGPIELRVIAAKRATGQ